MQIKLFTHNNIIHLQKLRYSDFLQNISYCGAEVPREGALRRGEDDCSNISPQRIEINVDRLKIGNTRKFCKRCALSPLLFVHTFWVDNK